VSALGAHRRNRADRGPLALSAAGAAVVSGACARAGGAQRDRVPGSQGPGRAGAILAAVVPVGRGGAGSGGATHVQSFPDRF
jgi:hypothetical protein